MAKKYIVTLTQKERGELTELIKKGKNAVKIRRAYILLGADAAADGKQMTNEAISQAYRVGLRTVERLRKRLVSTSRYGVELAKVIIGPQKIKLRQATHKGSTNRRNW